MIAVSAGEEGGLFQLWRQQSLGEEVMEMMRSAKMQGAIIYQVTNMMMWGDSIDTKDVYINLSILITNLTPLSSPQYNIIQHPTPHWDLHRQIYLILLMFTEQLSFLSVGHQQEKPSFTSVTQSQRASVTQADLSYEICSTFMRHTGHRFSQRQSQLMESSRQFLDLFANLKRKQIDSSRTLDTFLQDITDGSIPIDEERSLNRKNSHLFGSRKNLLLMGDQLAEIQERCSEGCYNFFNSLVAEYKKMESKIKQLDGKQASILKREEFLDKLHEENIILKKRLEHQAEKIEIMTGEILMLKEKNRSINSCINEKINTINNQHKYFEINHKVYKDIKGYIQEKEAALKSQLDHITYTENNVMKAIEQAFANGSCVKCCEILKKLKESIIRFKKYLQGESAEFQRIYDKYKKTMYSVKSRPSI